MAATRGRLPARAAKGEREAGCGGGTHNGTAVQCLSRLNGTGFTLRCRHSSPLSAISAAAVVIMLLSLELWNNGDQEFTFFLSVTDSCCDWEEAPLVRETFLSKARVVRRAFREMGLQDNDRFTARRQRFHKQPRRSRCCRASSRHKVVHLIGLRSLR